MQYSTFCDSGILYNSIMQKRIIRYFETYRAVLLIKYSYLKCSFGKILCLGAKDILGLFLAAYGRSFQRYPINNILIWSFSQYSANRWPFVMCFSMCRQRQGQVCTRFWIGAGMGKNAY